jgi:hypothetical protein
VGCQPHEYVLFGSLPMWFLGLRTGVGDIDVFVTREIWAELWKTGLWNLETPRADDPSFLSMDTLPPIHVFYDWDKRSPWMDVQACFDGAQEKDGWRYAPLAEVRKWKDASRRFKDLHDLTVIDRYLKEGAKA